jgi:anthranilate/para-aminobenzoate synthase component II
MVTTDNPLDLDNNKRVDEADIDRFLPAFGVTDKDPNYIEEYDIYPQNIKEGTQGDGRIDIQDLYHLVKAVSEQEELAKKIKEVNPDFVYPAIDQSIKTKVLTQICDIFPPLGLGLGKNQKLTFEAIANQIETIYKIHGKTITKKEESKSLYQRIQEFFNTPTFHALSKKREEETQG